jgi:hypothetical protein
MATANPGLTQIEALSLHAVRGWFINNCSPHARAQAKNQYARVRKPLAGSALPGDVAERLYSSVVQTYPLETFRLAHPHQVRIGQASRIPPEDVYPLCLLACLEDALESTEQLTVDAAPLKKQLEVSRGLIRGWTNVMLQPDYQMKMLAIARAAVHEAKKQKLQKEEIIDAAQKSVDASMTFEAFKTSFKPFVAALTVRKRSEEEAYTLFKSAIVDVLCPTSES